MRVTKHFVTVAGRRMHYHRAGEGPVVALLHASPCSAKVLREPLQVFASRFTALAFDTPGFGLSDLLPLKQPEIEDFADNLAATLSALGIEDAATYGRHTGGAIAVEYAIRHPQRCAMALTDGYPVFTGSSPEERIRSYLTPIVPSWEGQHLVWLWFRYREQHMFWPWWAKTQAQRADTDMPDLDFLHRGVVELLEAGDDYRIGYAAAFHHRGLAALADIRRPVCFGNRPGDSQHKTMKLYPKQAWTEEMPRDPLAATARELQVLLRHPARTRPPRPPAVAPIADRTTTEYVDLGDRQVFVRSAGDLKHEPPVVVLPPLPGSSLACDELVRLIGRTRPALALDMPGHGESDGDEDSPQSVNAWTRALRRVLDALGIGKIDLYGHNAGAAVAVEFTLRDPGRVRHLSLDAPICLPEAERARLAPIYAPDARPSWDGAHLLRVWHMLRDQELWWPWFERRRENARTTGPRIDPVALTIRAREALKQPASFAPAWRAALEYSLERKLAAVATPTTLMAAREDVFAFGLSRAGAARPDARVIEIADSASARCEAIFAALG
jgi:pimeloyl-ACP methyl ester carboxylesterase